MFVLAHLSDVHLAPLPKFKLYELAGKRIGGLINWHRNRRAVHLPGVLDALVADVKARAPDHIAVTGDLVNLSLAAEFAPARAWLEQLGPPARVTFVPGNHDTYVRSKARHPRLYWREFMSGNETFLPQPERDGVPRGGGSSEAMPFPFVRRYGSIALIGLSSAVPAPPFRATGWLGAGQLARFARALGRLGREGGFRVVLVHHPPVSEPEDRNERLLDGAALLAVLREQGAELVLHGHEHRHALRWFDTPGGRVPAIGVPPASAALGSRRDAAAYNLYEIDGAPGAWRCAMISRGLSSGGAGVVELTRQVLT